MKLKTAVCFCSAMFVAALVVEAQETGKRPSETIRFERGEHPRIWIARADLPEIRSRCAAGGTHAREFTRLKKLVDLAISKAEPDSREAVRYLTDPVPAAFLYQVTGKREYAEYAKKMLGAYPQQNARPARRAGVALDWILTKCDADHDAEVPVTPAELTELATGLTSTGGRWQLLVEHYRGRYDFPYAKTNVHHPFEKPWQYTQPTMFYVALALHEESAAFAKYDTALDWIITWAKTEWIAATNRRNKLSRCTRQIVYLKPDLFVMCDRVDSTDPVFAKTWLMHTINEPTLEGSLYSAEEGQGKLMVRRLAPEGAAVRKVRGSELTRWTEQGREWSQEVLGQYRSNPNAPWRIEESPTEKRTDDAIVPRGSASWRERTSSWTRRWRRR